LLRASLLLLSLGFATAPASAAPREPDLDPEAVRPKVQANRFQASALEIALVSGDRVGREQSIRLRMRWRRHPERDRASVPGCGRLNG
jgi:hypothetical protein